MNLVARTVDGGSMDGFLAGRTNLAGICSPKRFEH